MPRTVRPTTFGGPDVLEVVDLPAPSPAAGEVVVDVRAAGVNPIDWKLYSGSFHDVDDAHRADVGTDADPLPRIGFEAAGVITAVGSGVADHHVGDEVIVHPVTAAYADQVVVPVGSLVPKPASLGWAEASGLMLAGATAVHALDAAGVGDGDTVLVHGASGGVGLMVVQLAVGRGATPVGTASERNHGLLGDLGAVPVAYGPGLLDRVRAAAPGGVTAAIDLVGTDEALDTSLELIVDRDRISSVTGGPRRAKEGLKVLGYGPGEDSGDELRAAARQPLADAAGAGDVRVVVAMTFPLDRAADAHRAGLAGHAPGKLVLLP